MIAVSLFKREVQGAGRRKKFRHSLRWREAVLDENGQPAVGADGKAKMRLRQENCHTGDRVEAEALRKKKYRELNGLESAERETAHVALSKLAELDAQWLKNRDRAQGTRYLTLRSIQHLERVLTAKHGRQVFADEIDAQDVEDFISARKAEGVGAKTLNNQVGCIRAAFNRAVKAGALKENPFGAFVKVREDEPTIRPLTPNEQTALLAACADDQELDLFVRIALDTGCRAGEISNLRVEDLQLDDGLGRVESNTTWHSKNRKSRYIAFAPETVSRIRAWIARRLLFKKGRVFGNPGERPRAHYERMYRRFKQAATAAGIRLVPVKGEVYKYGPHRGQPKQTTELTLHDLRRTVGTRLAARGVNEKVASEYLGHSSVTTTARFYQTVAPETIKEAGRALRRTGSDE